MVADEVEKCCGRKGRSSRTGLMSMIVLFPCRDVALQDIGLSDRSEHLHEIAWSIQRMLAGLWVELVIQNCSLSPTIQGTTF